MHRRTFLLATGAACAALPAHADGVPYGTAIGFVAHRNGQRIGTHALAFRVEDGRQIASTQIDFTVRLLGIAVYRYRHHSREVWSDGQFLSLASETDDHGDKYAVQARQEQGGLVVRRREPQSFQKTSGGDEALEQQHWIRDVHPGRFLPTTHWNIEQTRQHALLNTQNGRISQLAVREIGREAVRTATSAPPATRFAYTGDIQMEQLFDDRARWVKSTFRAATDGSTIEYTLQG
jgi:hypothetical protein